MAERKLNEIEGVSLLSAGHCIVTLDATEDDLLEARGESDKLRQIQDVLFSDAAQAMDEGLKQKLKDYMDTKTKAVARQNIMDTINIDTKGVAQDMIQILDVGQRQTEIEHLLGSVISPLSAHQTLAHAGDDNSGGTLEVPGWRSDSVEEKKEADRVAVVTNGGYQPVTLVCA